MKGLPESSVFRYIPRQKNYFYKKDHVLRCVDVHVRLEKKGKQARYHVLGHLILVLLFTLESHREGDMDSRQLRTFVDLMAVSKGMVFYASHFYRDSPAQNVSQPTSGGRFGFLRLPLCFWGRYAVSTAV